MDINSARGKPKARRASEPPRDAGGRFASQAPWQERLPKGSASWAKPGDYVSSLITDAQGGRWSSVNTLALVPGRALFTEMGRDLMAAKSYLRTKEKMDALRQDWHDKMDKIAQDWLALKGAKGWVGLGVTPATRRQKKALEQANDRLMKLMHEATRAQIDPSKPFAPGNLKGEDLAEAQRSYEAIRAKFMALPEAHRAMFSRVRDAYGEMADATEQAVIDNVRKSAAMAIKEAERIHAKEMRRIADEGLTGKEKDEATAVADKKLKAAKDRGGWGLRSRIIALRQTFEANRLSGPYFPLSRTGNFYVTARDASGKVVYFAKHKTSLEQQRDRDRMAQEGFIVEAGQIGDIKSYRDMVSASFVAEVESLLGDAGAPADLMDAVWQRWLETLPELSIRKSRIHRQGTPGFDPDALRAFTSHVFHGAHQLARLKHGLDLEDALADAELEAARAPDPTRAQAVVQEMRRRHEFTMNPISAAWTAHASTLAYLWHLGASPAAAIVNLSQTTVIGPAILGARFPRAGVTGAVNALAKAGKDYGQSLGRIETSDLFTPEEKAAVEEALKRGTIDRTQAHDLASVAETGVEYNGHKEAVMRKISWAFHQAEVMNRTVTFLAAYRMARRAGLLHEDAIDAGADLTWKTHFSYQSSDRPRFMQSDWPKVFTIFRQYSVNLIFRLARDLHQSFAAATPELRREARTQFAAITLSMMAHAGIKGTWGYGIIMTLLAMVLPGDDDDLERYLHDALLMEEATPGATAWNYGMGALLNGIPGQLTGTDLSARIGSPNLWFREQDKSLEGEDSYWALVQDLMGPAVAIPASWWRGASIAADGEWWRGGETLAPKAIRDLLKAWRFATDGVETMKGDPIVEDTDWRHSLKQALGFTPADVAEQYDANTWMRNRDRRAANWKSGVLNDVAESVRDGEGITEALMEQIRAYNRAWPADPITGETIRRSMRARAQASERSEGGLVLSSKREGQIREEMPPSLYGN